MVNTEVTVMKQEDIGGHGRSVSLGLREVSGDVKPQMQNRISEESKMMTPAVAETTEVSFVFEYNILLLMK